MRALPPRKMKKWKNEFFKKMGWIKNNSLCLRPIWEPSLFWSLALWASKQCSASFFRVILGGKKETKTTFRETSGLSCVTIRTTRETKKTFSLPIVDASKWRTPKSQPPHTQALSKTLRGVFLLRQWSNAVSCSALKCSIVIAMRRIIKGSDPLMSQNW